MAYGFPMNRFLTYVVLLLTMALVSACSQLPEYAQPHMVQTDELQKSLAAGFSYRPLTPDDFRATSLSEQQAEHAGRINAHATIQIRATADSSFRVTRGDLSGRTFFFGGIERLAFEAVILPDLSWWNPKIPANMRGYVLQHEQIHFALAELAARRLTRDTQKWASEVLVIKPTPQEVRAELVRQIKDRIKAAMEANLKQQAEFDNDTSLFYSPEWQQWWYRKVEKELKQTHRGRKDHGKDP